jgi:aspartyl-tRNA(Asn)/glutamyl-tRNA(Gln) amidotransferase subunit B
LEVINNKYEVVIGLEVHAQLLTQTKLFCGDSAAFGADPNTHVSPVTLAHPGSLPVLNKKAIEYAIKMGIACHCEIEPVNYFARKHYFYPDLPKGYQISQHTTPICKNGHVKIKVGDLEKKVKLNRIHLEEDAGKSMHDIDDEYTSVDLNRAGVPLIEIVSEPDMRSSEEAFKFLTELRKLLRYLEVCDGNMEEGSLRCDANVSIRIKGETKLGTKVEVKNLNSIKNVKRAIDYETHRMIGLAENNQPVVQQTRSFDAGTETTFALRTKEQANDYRYFPDPDLPPFQVTTALLERVKATIPALPEELMEKYTTLLQLPEYDAQVISDDKELSDYFERLIKETGNYKAASNWLIGPVKSYLNDKQITATQFPLMPSAIAQLIALIDAGKLNFSIASSRVFPHMINSGNAEAMEVATALNLIQNSDTAAVSAWVEEALSKMPAKVLEYQKGKKGLMGLFVGEVKKLSNGKADPKLTSQLLLEKLEKS